MNDQDTEAGHTPTTGVRKFYGHYLGVLEAIAAAGLAFLICLMFFGLTMRYVFSRPLVFGDELSALVFVWVIMIGSVLAIARNQHMQLTLFVDALPPGLKGYFSAFGKLVMGAFLILIAFPSFEHLQMEAFLTLPGLGISGGWRVASLCVGIALMLIALIEDILSNVRLRELLVAAIVLALILGALWLLRPVFFGLGRLNILIFLVGVLVLCLFLGVPIAFCFGAAVVSFLVFTTRLPLSVVVGRMDEGMASLILLSVPVFILLGGILDRTGMGKSIVDFLLSMIGHVKGGMSYVLLGSLFLVSGISGSKVSDMATVAPALFPEMKRRGHKPRDMVALMSVGAIMADTVPPSIILIVVGSVAGVSIAALFTSGFVVAIWFLLVLAIGARWKARHEDMSSIRKSTWRMIGAAALIAAPALTLPFLIRIAVGEGIATATEVSTIAVIYAFIAGQIFYGGIGVKTTYRLLVQTAIMTGAIMLIIGTASAGAWALTQTGFSRAFALFITDLPGGWISYMFLTIAVFIILGCILEGLPAVVLLAPTMFPVALALGIHPVHYAMVVVVAMNIGMFLPPIGIMYYIACSIGQVKPMEPLKGVMQYLSLIVLGLIILALVPAISLWVL